MIFIRNGPRGKSISLVMLNGGKMLIAAPPPFAGRARQLPGCYFLKGLRFDR
jgi:hypothetical protein